MEEVVEALVALLLRCGVVAHVDVLAAIVAVESRGNPIALAVNGPYELVRAPRSLSEAVATAQWLLEHGHNFDAGLAQVNSANLARLGLDSASVFDSCGNVRAAGLVLEECFQRAAHLGGGNEHQMDGAVSCYNTGHRTRGIANGYANAVRVAWKSVAASPSHLSAPTSILGPQAHEAPLRSQADAAQRARGETAPDAFAGRLADAFHAVTSREGAR